MERLKRRPPPYYFDYSPIILVKADNVEINGFRIEASMMRYTGIGGSWKDGSDYAANNLNVHDNTFAGFTYAAVIVDRGNAQNLIVANNDMSGSAGLNLWGLSGGSMNNNIGISSVGIGIFLMGCDGTTLSGNEITAGPSRCLKINSPAGISGNYPAGYALFGPWTWADLTGNVVYAEPHEACTAITNDVNGKIALIDRGACAFTVKVKNAQDAGAIGVIIANNQPGIVNMGGTDPSIVIPAISILQSDGDAIKAELPGVDATLLSSSCSTGPIIADEGIHIQGCDDVTVQGNTISNFACGDVTGYNHGKKGAGIGITGSSDITIEDNTMNDNSVDVKIYGNSDNVEIHCNSFDGSTDYGVFNGKAPSGSWKEWDYHLFGPADYIVDATCNWWGDCSGPSGEGTGSGDAVSTNVDFDPWIGKVVADAGGPYVSVDGSFVQFDSSGSSCYCGESLLYLWDFGDGDTSTLENPMHTYTSVGGYTVTLTVEGSLTHCTDVDTTTVTVTSTVTSNANGPYEGVVGIPIDFTGSASDGVPPYSYYWSFGDNVYSYAQNPSHKYKQPGTYTVSLKVTDDIDGQDTDSTYVIIHSPETLVADAGGPYSGGVDQVIAFTGNAVGGVTPYTFEWDLDNDGDYDDATGQFASKSWSTIGTYTISLKVTDNIGTTDTDTAQVSITSHAPNKPSKPSGPTSGKAGNEYTYTSSTTDPDDDDVFYLFDWDDGTDSGWLGPYDSGDTVTASHTWTEKGDYQIKVKAKDEYDVESPWSDPLSVSMPKNKAINNPFLLFLERLIERFPILARLLQLPVFEKLMNLR